MSDLTGNRAFQVDLRGVVDLLSRHLYSSPRVYIRELLQNACDAITARGAGPGSVIVEVGSEISVSDDGIGLTEDEVHILLATIGRSSKRDELGFARHEFLGQFGIGLLSGFLVADEIRVVTRSARGGATVAWIGRSDGSYQVGPAEKERDEPGTTVTLTPRRDAAEWAAPTTVRDLSSLYGSLLPAAVSVDGVRISGEGPPWARTYRTPDERRSALLAYGHEVFGFTAFDVIDLAVPEAGLTGVAYVLPHAANPAARAGHRVYLKRMLLAESAAGILPEWAFFARCVVDAAELRPTASREALYEDDLLEHTRSALGDRLREWLVTLAETDPARLRAFLRLHHLGVKALALHDDDLLRLVDEWLEFETSDGPMTLAEFRRRHPDGRYTSDVDEFRQLSGVSGAQGIGLLNGGYVYDADIIDRLPRLGGRIPRLDPGELSTRLTPVDAETELSLQAFLREAARVLAPLGCDVVLRDFDPASLPALYLTSRASQHQAELRDAREAGDELWADVLGAIEHALDNGGDRPRLVLNHRNPLVRRITRLPDTSLAATAVEALYGLALLHGRHPLRAADTAALNRSFLGLLDWAVLGRE